MMARAGGAMPQKSNDFSWLLVMNGWASALVKYFIYSKNLLPFLKFYIAFILYLNITAHVPLCHKYWWLLRWYER